MRVDDLKDESGGNVTKPYGIYNTITIGEWCIFWSEIRLVIGQVLCFQYVSDKTKNRTRYRPYHLDTAPVSHHRKRNGLVVICSWFAIVSESRLEPCVELTPVTIESYAGHITAPRCNASGIFLDEDSHSMIREIVDERQNIVHLEF